MIAFATDFSTQESECGFYFTCFCDGTSSSAFHEEFPGVPTSAECSDSCATAALSAGIFEDVTYRFQCQTPNGIRFQTSGTTRTQPAASLTEEPAREPIIPNLNVPVPGLDETDFRNSVTVDSVTGKTNSNLLGVYIRAWYSFLITAGAVAAVMMLTIGGIEYIIARGNPSRIGKAKTRMQNAVIGMILLLMAYNVAFLLDPRAVQFDAISTRNIQREEGIHPDGEDVDAIVPNTSLNSMTTVPVQGDGIIMHASDPRVTQETLDALQVAAAALQEDHQGAQLRVSSAFRSPLVQAQLFYQNCLARRGGVCAIPTCNPASSAAVVREGSGYRAVGAAAGQSGSALVSTIASFAEPGNCPHTSGVALDVWCAQGGSFSVNVECQQQVITAMTENGFCRLGSEPWHFELNTQKVSSHGCSTQNNTTVYTRRGTVYDPAADGCIVWDFKQNLCSTAR